MSRCSRAGHDAFSRPLADRGFVGTAAEQMTRAGDGRPCIVDLMSAEQPRQRQIDERIAGLEDKPAMLLVSVPFPALDQQRRADLFRAAFDGGHGLVILPCDDAGNAGLEDTRFLAGYLIETVAQIMRVIE